jgi:putative tryptophan/tyrosine transport system substrate-binding protein
MLGVLKEIAPNLRRCGLLVHPDNDSVDGYQRAFSSTASSLGVEPVTLILRASGDVEQALTQFAQTEGGGLLVTPDVFLASHRDLIAATALRVGLPVVGPYRAFVRSGALMSFGVEQAELFGQAALYVDRILRGEKPGELPVQAPTQFRHIINLTTAKALRIEIPPTMLARADEVIE